LNLTPLIRPEGEIVIPLVRGKLVSSSLLREGRVGLYIKKRRKKCF